MAGGGAAQFGVAALLAVATPTPTPNPTGVAGCHAWRYTLHWDRPSRLATLKNALGNSVTLRKSFKAPGLGGQDDWPDPLVSSVSWTSTAANPGGVPNAGAWNWTSPPASAATTFAYDHDCDDIVKGGPACAVNGEHAGIWYEAGWDDPSDNWFYPTDPFTGKRLVDPVTGEFVRYATPQLGLIVAPTDPNGEVVDWSWTLNYGYGKAPGNDIIYGLDPGPPLPVYDMTAAVGSPIVGNPLAGGYSIPGITGTPLPFPDTWSTRGGFAIGVQPSPGVGGLYQPTWETLLPSDVVGKTAKQVNWGLMTFSDVSVDPISSNWCKEAANYDVKVPIVSNDSGDVAAIEEYLRLKYFSSGSHPGLSASGGTPTKHAIERAGTSLADSWNLDPKQRCARPWGVILCTDGLSNTCNTGSAAADSEWVAPNTPCENDVNGADFTNYPPGAAEAVYNAALTAGGGAAIIKPRTYAIGIAPEVGRCELNRIAYRGRTDASAFRKDAGFLLYDPAEVPGPPKGDADLPHIDALSNDQSGGGPPPDPNHFRTDQTPAVSGDYAFFALDSASIVQAFDRIVASTATGDYSTSAPVSGAGVAAGDIVLLPSTEYPSWFGHLRALDTTKLPSDVGYEQWDAALVLNSPSQPWQPTPATRAIYTWDPATGALIPVDTDPAHVAAMTALAGDPAFNGNVVDFMRGNDGSLMNKKRKWILGPAINSTPAVVGTPLPYKQVATVADHKPFETTYASRRPLAWVGSDDGFVHAFDFQDGTEILALIPPNLLRNQILLYKNYLAKETETGQKIDLDQHIWGVSNSFRYADVYFATGYKTVGIITEGPAGDMVAAIDITHPFPGYASPVVAPDPGYSATDPVKVLWTKSSADYAGLFGSWSVPALAADGFTTSRLFFGAGINPASLYNAQRDASQFIADPLDGTLNLKKTIVQAAAPTQLVGEQTFADGLFFQTNVPAYQPDNVANLAVQVDTNGRGWFTWGDFLTAGGTTTKIGIDLNANAGDIPQPIYYSPAATGQGRTGCQIFALASGSLYETSPAVSGWNVNRAGAVQPPFPVTLPPFTPYLYVGVNPDKITDATFASTPLGKAPRDVYMIKQLVGGEVPEALNLPIGDPALSPTRTKLGPRTQVTSSPFMAVDQSGKGEEQALFLLYDPDNGCYGRSYVVVLTFKIPGNCKPPNVVQVQTYGAGPGASSGIAITSSGGYAGQSGVGSGASAGLFKTEITPDVTSGAPAFFPVWWRDVK